MREWLAWEDPENDTQQKKTKKLPIFISWRMELIFYYFELAKLKCNSMLTRHPFYYCSLEGLEYGLGGLYQLLKEIFIPIWRQVMQQFSFKFMVMIREYAKKVGMD